MQALKIEEHLKNNSYPGRGITIGRTVDGKRAVIIYFIMGRSENSRNRIFEETEDGIRTKAFDSSKLTDPSLVIYHPVRRVGDITVVTNGDQTDTIRDALLEGKTYIDALRTRCFEPDPPIYTPRISGMVMPNGSYVLSILKSCGGDPDCNSRFFYEYDLPKPGMGHFIHTYQENLPTPPSFEGEPRPVMIEGGCSDIAENVWQSLDGDNKVSLFVRTIELETGKEETVIVNKNH